MNVCEQVVTIFRLAYNELVTREMFIGIYLTGTIDANYFVAIIPHFPIHSNLKFDNCYGQCSDGAGNMQDCTKGVAAQILNQ